jgi:hypothetical protein
VPRSFGICKNKEGGKVPMSSEMTIGKNDLVLIAASILGVLILALSIHGLFFSPLRDNTFDKEKAAAYKDLFDVIVKGTLLPLFTTLITTKIAYAVAKFALNKFADR